MNAAEKVEVFKEELEYIKNIEIRNFAKKAIELLPDYFFEIPASSTGKYHPSYSLGVGGLVRHVRSAVRIAVELYRMDMFRYFTDDEKDLMLVSLIMHDGWKSGKVQSKFTVAEHPLIAEEMIKFSPELKNIIPEMHVDYIGDAISSHMGQWNADYKSGKEVLPKPSTKSQNFVHLVDYIASRKMLEMNFDVKVDRNDSK